jgi:hypothetical protein
MTLECLGIALIAFPLLCVGQASVQNSALLLSYREVNSFNKRNKKSKNNFLPVQCHKYMYIHFSNLAKFNHLKLQVKDGKILTLVNLTPDSSVLMSGRNKINLKD